MKHHDITKLCADSLRSYFDNTRTIKLKSGHAHEIVAAFFGYKSRIAMLADAEYPISHLDRAVFIVTEMATQLVDHRLKSLDRLPTDLPSGSILAQRIRSIIEDNTLAGKAYSSFSELGLALAEDRLYERYRSLWNTKSFDWIKDAAVQKSKSEVLVTVRFGYRTNTGEIHRAHKYEIRLPRIAANLGYGEPELHPTAYSGLARTLGDEELDKTSPTRLSSVMAKP